MVLTPVKSGRRGRPANRRVVGWLSFSEFDQLDGSPIHVFTPEENDLFADSLFVVVSGREDYLRDPYNTYRVEFSTNGKGCFNRVVRHFDGTADILPLYFGSARRI